MPKALGLELRSHVVPLQDRIVGRAKTGLELMLLAVGIVLFIGCINITNLLLARLSSRRRELAVRSMLGASSWRLKRQMIVESLTLSAGGGGRGGRGAFFWGSADFGPAPPPPSPLGAGPHASPPPRCFP